MHSLEVDDSVIVPGPCYDLHCDLLSYLATGSNRTAWDLDVPCNLKDLQEGGVAAQVCAIFVGQEPNATAFGAAQFARFLALKAEHGSGSPQLFYAIENASALFGVIPDLSKGWERVDQWTTQAGPPLYVTLTWNGASALGGGSGCEAPLTSLGEAALAGLADRGIPIDLSHASDRLARDVLNWTEQHAPQLPLLLSHSNARAIQSHPRNAPDWLLAEIGARNGLVGLVWVRQFIGERATDLLRHHEHIVRIAGPHVIASGADLFWEKLDYPPGYPHLEDPFFQDLRRGADFRNLWTWVMTHVGQAQAEQWASGNAKRWMQSLFMVSEASHSP